MTDIVTVQDIFTLFHLNRSFKFVSKTSNFLIPIIGWSMFLTGKFWSTSSMACNLFARYDCLLAFVSLIQSHQQLFCVALGYGHGGYVRRVHAKIFWHHRIILSGVCLNVKALQIQQLVEA